MTSQDEYEKELIKLDFPEKLLSSQETNKNFLEYCKGHDMKYLKKSDGLLVNTKFDKHFKVSVCIKMRNKLSRQGHLYEKEDIKLPLENINLLRSKIDEKVFILISSPSQDLKKYRTNVLNYPYGIYLTHPNFLDNYTFIEERTNNPGEGLDLTFIEEKINNPSESLDHFVENSRHPLKNINYAFTNASESQIHNINEKIYQDTGLSDVFKKLL